MERTIKIHLLKGVYMKNDLDAIQTEQKEKNGKNTLIDLTPSSSDIIRLISPWEVH
jgi:hypothetical protein